MSDGRDNIDRCRTLASLIRRYATAARGTYANNPETMSITILTIMEMWVACDKSVTAEFPLLLEYSTGFHPGVFDRLVLLRREELARLACIEEYIWDRESHASGPPPWEPSFAVRYYDASPDQKQLHQRILDEAEKEKGEKLAELAASKEQYRTYMRQYEQSWHISRSCGRPRRGFDESDPYLVYSPYGNFGREPYTSENPWYYPDRDVSPPPNPLSRRMSRTDRRFVETYRVARRLRREVSPDPVISHGSPPGWDNSTDQSPGATLQPCLKCEAGRLGNQMRITAFQWPLPKGKYAQKAAVFELQVPDAIRIWRELTIGILVKYLTSPVAFPEKIKFADPAHHPILQRLVQKSTAKPGRFRFLSLPIPLLPIPLKEATSNNVLVDGFKCDFYDTRTSPTVRSLLVRLRLWVEFAYPPRTVPNTLRNWIVGTDHTLNEVIANQADCPKNMSLEEFKAHGNLRGGLRLQWQNILCQLTIPALDFNRCETLYLVLQASNEVGPRSRYSLLRETHAILEEEEFARALLIALKDAFERVQGNWENYISFFTFVSLGTRLLSACSIEWVRDGCLRYLAEIRSKSMDWAHALLAKLGKSISADERQQLNGRVLCMALVCHSTFDIGAENLSHLLSDAEQASLLIKASMLVSEHHPPRVGDWERILTIFLQRWYRLSYETELILRREIIQKTSPCLDKAIKWIWEPYSAGTAWSIAEMPREHILVATSSSTANLKPNRLQYNLLTGSLLVDGSPISTLPHHLQTHPTYQRLFGNQIIRVFPSLMRLGGMRYSAASNHFGHEIHFGEVGKELIVRTQKYNKIYELIPKEKLGEDFPALLVSEYVHWLVVGDHRVEFRPIDEAWQTSDDLGSSEVLVLEFPPGHPACLRKSDSSQFIDIRSKTASILSQVLQPLEDPVFLHMTYDKTQSHIIIELPRFRLSFTLNSGDKIIKATHYRGFIIDEHQSIGTLPGLISKLVLRLDNTARGVGQRVVIVPHGTVFVIPESTGHAKHVVKTGKERDVRHHLFHVNTTMGLLREQGSLKTKLFLSYLHAVTTHCLPDRLTGRTGTEEALRILRLEAVRSFDRLDDEEINLLHLIANLSPCRTTVNAGIQKVVWSSLSPTTQEDSFYLLATSILDQAKKHEIFFPRDGRRISFPSPSEGSLIERQRSRAAIYQTSQFGAECFESGKDEDYASRDTVAFSPQEYQAYNLAKFLESRHEDSLLGAIRPPNGDGMHKFFTSYTQKSNEDFVFELDAEFDLGWLKDPSSIPINGWCEVLKQLSQSDLSRERYRIMMFLVGLVFAQKADGRITQLLLAFATSPTLRTSHPPNFDHFSLWTGILPTKERLQEIVEVARFEQSSSSRRSRGSSRERTSKSPTDKIVDEFVNGLYDQWPSETIEAPSSYVYSSYLDVEDAMKTVREHWKSWIRNQRILDYFQEISQIVSTFQVVNDYQLPYWTGTMIWKKPDNKMTRSISIDDLFNLPVPSTVQHRPDTFKELIIPNEGHVETQPGMSLLLDNLRKLCHLDHERSYIKEVEKSLEKFHQFQHTSSIDIYSIREPTDRLIQIFEAYRMTCEREVVNNFGLITAALSRTASASAHDVTVSTLWPRLTPVLLLQQLTRKQWSKLTQGWKGCLIDYAVSVTSLQRAERLLKSVQNPNDLVKELQNIGHENWNPMDFPESLLFEVENNLLVRRVQEQIAQSMRNPPNGENAVMQLNMGEGKSTVIVPIVTAALADGVRLVRVIVTKPQSRQMLHSLTNALGGLLSHRVYTLPFSRDFKSENNEAGIIEGFYSQCRTEGGVLLVQPEQLLSFKLLGVESMISDRTHMGQTLLKTQYMFDNFSKDVVDESDENFSVRFELTYTMGTQKPIDLSPQRWLLVQSIFTLIARFAPGVLAENLKSLEFEVAHEGAFPRIRIIDNEVGQLLMEEVAKHICEQGIEGYPYIARQTPGIRAAVLQYITKTKLTSMETSEVETRFSNESIFKPLLLLRGLIGGGILALSLHQKRWRVNYGRVYNRVPPTGLAVPYRAKDSPAPRSEFSHPDVVVVLTCLTYYYGGLSNDELFRTLESVFLSDQGDSLYRTWAESVPGLPSSFLHLSGVNIKDREQCIEEIFPHLRHVKLVIDYYLSDILFLKEMREFPEKLSGSGWDIAMSKRHPTTGFSGTNDSKFLLPLSIRHLDLEEQKATNALMLNCLLRPENSVFEINLHDRHSQGMQLVSEFLLRKIMEFRPRIQVILDVGAQILELDNLEATKTWLALLPPANADAGIFFDEQEELCVVTRSGVVEPFRTSPYSTNTGSCIVFLDEAHTRGTDLRLPNHYQAAVTLGPNLNKDKLIQACMRMRNLGKGQSVVFFASEEIRRKICEILFKATGSVILSDYRLTTADVLMWSIWETWQESYKCIPIWASQGMRYQRQDLVWDEARSENGFEMTREIASKYLDKEARTVEERYRPSDGQTKAQDTSNFGSACNEQLRDRKRHELEEIRLRCEQFGLVSYSSSGVHEEQERELSAEVEEERHVHVPPRMRPHEPFLHEDVKKFVATGKILSGSEAFLPAFMAFKDSTVAKLVDLSVLPADILVTVDFTRTVKLDGRSDVSDDYQRPVQWLLTSFRDTKAKSGQTDNHMVVVSPWEVNNLLPDIRRSSDVILHMYAPRTSLAYSSMEGLTLYTAPIAPAGWQPPKQLVLQLILFAGQLYLRSYPDYLQLCRFLGLSTKINMTADENILADGFIQSSAGRGCIFRASPLPFLKVLVEQIRRGCEDISKTDIGHILVGKPLTEEQFAGNLRLKGSEAAISHE